MVGGIGIYIVVKGVVNVGIEFMFYFFKYLWWYRGWFIEIDKKGYSIIKII